MILYLLKSKRNNKSFGWFMFIHFFLGVYEHTYRVFQKSWVFQRMFSNLPHLSLSLSTKDGIYKVRIYERKISRKKERKHAFNQEKK